MKGRSRPVVGLVLILALGAVAGCGSTAATPVASYGHGPTVTPLTTESPAVEPTDTTTLTDGYGTAEEAIKAWLLAQGLTYSGDCETGAQTADTYCSARFSTVSSGTVYISGPVRSEAAYWLLLRQMGGLWYVVEWAGFSETGGPPADWN